MDSLLTLAEQENIIVEQFPFSYPLMGIYLHESDKVPIIGLSTFISSNAVRRCIMAEELGHHFTSAGISIPGKYEFYSFIERTEISKTEYKALKWAANYLMPEHDLLNVIRSGLYEKWELADHFNVTEEFVAFRLKLFESQRTA
jgi:Zn-dependent peptidase ImmA (M78 family)